MVLSSWKQILGHIAELEEEGLITRTFRRLDPDRQQAVLTAILDEAIEKGPASINVKEIAGRAGVSVGSLYQYFRNREGLLSFTVELCVRFVVDAFDGFRPVLASLPLREALKAYVTGGVQWSRSQLALIQFFARAAYQGDPALGERVVAPIATAMRGMVGEILAKAAERGEIRKGVDLEAATRIVHALMCAAGDSLLLPYLNTYFQVQGPAVPWDRALEALLDLTLQGLGAG